MKAEQRRAEGRERRTEVRNVVDEYYSVQFFIKPLASLYQFVLWDISSQGMCILVENDSDVLQWLSVGEVFRIKFYPRQLHGQSRICSTEIRHISRGAGKRFQNYHLVGLKILD